MLVVMVAVYLFVQMCCIWGLYRLFKNPSIVDVSWSLGLMVSGLIYIYSAPSSTRQIVIGALLSLWAVRLAGYLWYTRVRKGHVDKRYLKLSENWKISQSLGFFLNFQLQALMILFISSIFLLVAMSSQTNLTRWDVIAIMISLLGIVGETLADWQLTQFRKQSAGEVCDVGLWYYSRHPNYFFDWLTWVGFTLFALQSQYGYLAILPLLFLYVIFTRITGPLTEKGSIQSRGQKYLSYQATTSMFFPWVKKKSDFE